MKKYYSALVAVFYCLAAHAQPSLMWANEYNGLQNNADQAVSIAVDANGNSYVTGSAYAANGTLDMVTIKYSPAGAQLWLHNFNGSADANDQGNMIVLDASANVYVTGYANNLNSGQDIATIKYNSSGVLQWIQFYDGPTSNSDNGIALKVDNSGNVYVSGVQTMPGITTDFITLKYNSTGALQWFQSYNGPGNVNDDAKDIGLDANGNVYVTGTSDTIVSSSPNEDIVLLKYNNAGVFQWRKVFNSNNGFEFSKKLAIDRNSNILVAGYAFVTGHGYDYFIFKWDSSGTFKWMNTYNYATNTFETPNAILTDSLNNVIVAGQGIAPSSGSTNDYVTVKYDSSGTFLWASRYNNVFHGEDRAYAAALDDSLNIYVTGFSKGSGTAFDIATIKYDQAGNQMYVLRYNNTANMDDVGNAIAVRNGDIYVAGVTSNGNNNDYITLRYSYGTPLSAPIEEEATAREFTCYPNPSHGIIHVLLPDEFSANDNARVEIVNASGQLIYSSADLSAESSGSHEVLTIEPGELVPGFYFMLIYTNGELAGTAKFVTE